MHALAYTVNNICDCCWGFAVFTNFDMITVLDQFHHVWYTIKRCPQVCYSDIDASKGSCCNDIFCVNLACCIVGQVFTFDSVRGFQGVDQVIVDFAVSCMVLYFTSGK